MTQKKGKFAKKYVSLKKNREFQFLFRKGASTGTYAFVCYIRQSKRRVNRLGIITSKKIGNSVRRSRSRRVIREAFRKIEPELRETAQNRYDFVFVARTKTAETSSRQIYELIKKNVIPKISSEKIKRNSAAPDNDNNRKNLKGNVK